MSDGISTRFRNGIIRRARRRCEYCLSPLDISTDPFEVEHILSRIRGGTTTTENLALSCSGFNGHKYNKLDGYDPVSEAKFPLYHPRKDRWQDHFIWSDDYLHIIGLSPVGRVTITALHLNRPNVVNLRAVLFVVGLHPPVNNEQDE